MASSLVGVTTSAFMVRFSQRGVSSPLSICSVGMANAAVLPVPVWAQPSRSRPLSTTGIASS